ncbi:Tubulin-specific chaperone E, partial [Geodia barretti]
GPLLKDTLLSVVISCPDHPEATQLSKRLPGSMTVQKLKGLLRRVHKVDSSRQRLSYLDSSRNIEIKMDDDLKQLLFFAIQSGDTILLRW